MKTTKELKMTQDDRDKRRIQAQKFVKDLEESQKSFRDKSKEFDVTSKELVDTKSEL